jgi:dCMP deaminase
MDRPTKDEYLMDMAVAAAARSSDRSTQVGCVITGKDGEIRTTGYNGFPRKVKHEGSGVEHRHERPLKYKFSCHAEENAVAQAARSGVSLLGCTAYVTHAPCAACTRMFIQAGIRRIVTNEPTAEFLERWEEDYGVARIMAAEANIPWEHYDE